MADAMYNSVEFGKNHTPGFRLPYVVTGFEDVMSMMFDWLAVIPSGFISNEMVQSGDHVDLF